MADETGLVPEEAIRAALQKLPTLVLRAQTQQALEAAAPLILAANPAKLAGADRASLGEALQALGLLDDEDLSDVTMRAAQWFDEWLTGRASVLRGEGQTNG